MNTLHKCAYQFLDVGDHRNEVWDGIAEFFLHIAQQEQCVLCVKYTQGTRHIRIEIETFN